MSGHSKFANIKHKKEKNDAAKGKVFTIIGREIAVAVKEGGPDPNNNFKLAQVIAKAKANNMPNDTIERGIKKAAGDGNAVNYEHVTYEGYGPNGIAVIVIRTELQLMSEVHLLRAMEALVLRDVFPLCSMRRDRSLLTKKSVI
jgi:transcriptional/translational regulatory protein YebC/TACO1